MTRAVAQFPALVICVELHWSSVYKSCNCTQPSATRGTSNWSEN